MTKQPWLEYDKIVGEWDAENFPFVVRWDVPYPDRLTRWVSHNRAFRTLAEAVAAYKRPFRGLSVDLVKFNGGKPGEHLTRLAWRKCNKPTRWHDTVPLEMRK